MKSATFLNNVVFGKTKTNLFFSSSVSCRKAVIMFIGIVPEEELRSVYTQPAIVSVCLLCADLLRHPSQKRLNLSLLHELK